MELDIYIPKLKLAIEYDGEQHFKPVRFNTASWEFAKQKYILQTQRDKLKNELIKNNSFHVSNFIRFSCKDSINRDYIVKRIYEVLDVNNAA